MYNLYPIRTYRNKKEFTVCFCTENEKAFQLKANHPHFQQAHGKVGSVYSEVQVNKLELICRESQYGDLSYVGPPVNIMADRTGLKTLPSRNFVDRSGKNSNFIQGFNMVTKILAIFYHGADTFSRVVCFAYLWFNRASSTGNVITICLISIERFLCIFFPFKSMIWITTARMKKVMDFYFLWLIETQSSFIILNLTEVFEATELADAYPLFFYKFNWPK